LSKVSWRSDVIWGEPEIVELLAVIRNRFGRVLEKFLQPAPLHSFDFLGWGEFITAEILDKAQRPRKATHFEQRVDRGPERKRYNLLAMM
jgi:hypothetical protein